MTEIRLKIDEATNEAIAILPGEWVSYFLVELPDFSQNKLEKIIPSILSDQLAGGIDTIHYAIIEKQDDGNSIIAVCDKDRLKDAKELADKGGYTLKAIWPDYQELDVPKTGVNLLRDEKADRVLGRRSNGTGFTAPLDMVEHIVRGLTVHEGQLINLPKKAGLATGDFSPRPPFNNYIKYLSRAFALLVVVFFIWFFQVWTQISTYEEERLQYSDASLVIFKNTHPDVERIVNVEAQMRALMGDGALNGNQGFLAISDSIFNAIKDTTGIKLENISYDIRNNQEAVNITISSVNFSQATNFEGKLEELGFSVIQGGSSQNGDIIFSSYSLEGEAL